MAHKKSKRVTRIKNGFEGINEECRDYVDSIMKEMDSNFLTVQYSKSTPLPRICGSTEEENILKNASSPSTSQDCARNFPLRSRKFGLARKFPLMEKSQKILKHLKHNQRIPKQRAHLASFPKQPAGRDTKRNDSPVRARVQKVTSVERHDKPNQTSVHGNSGISIQERASLKRSIADANKIKNASNRSSSVESRTNSFKKSKNCDSNQFNRDCCPETSNVDSERNIVNVGKSIKSSKTNLDSLKQFNIDCCPEKYNGNSERSIVNVRKSIKSSSKDLDSLKQSKASETANKCNKERNEAASDSKGDTTDSEYERFLQNSKKGLRMKCHKQKPSKTKSKSVKKAQRAVAQQRRLEPTSESSDEESSSNAEPVQHKKHKVGHRPKRKTQSSARLLTDVDAMETRHDTSSELDYAMDGDTFTRDTSSESEGPSAEKTISAFSDQEGNECLPMNPESTSLGEEWRGTTVNPEVPTECSGRNSLSSNTSLVIDEASCEEDPCESASPNNLTVEEKRNGTLAENRLSSVTSLIIDEAACEEDPRESASPNDLTIEKEKNGAATDADQNNSSDHEDSDIEIVEVVVHKPGKERVSSGQVNSGGSSVGEDSRSKESIARAEVCESGLQCSVQKRESPDPQIQSESLVSCKSEPPTACRVPEIKKEDSDDEILIVDCILKKKPVGSSAVPLSQNNETVVKREHTAVKTDTKYSTDDPNIKTEKCPLQENVSLKELKMYEVACANLALATQNLSGEEKLAPHHPEEPKGDGSIDVKNLLEMFKKEFQIYEEIVQAEVNLEANLKKIESYQAEKLRNIRALIKQTLSKSGQCIEKDLKTSDRGMLEKGSCSGIPENKCSLSRGACSSGDVLSQSTSEQKAQNSYAHVTDRFLPQAPSDSTVSSQPILLIPSDVALDEDVKPNAALLQALSGAAVLQQPAAKLKQEPISIQGMPIKSEKDTIRLLGEKCNVCGREAVAACQRCAKVFFCSNECGKRFWISGHENECGK